MALLIETAPTRPGTNASIRNLDCCRTLVAAALASSTFAESAAAAAGSSSGTTVQVHSECVEQLYGSLSSAALKGLSHLRKKRPVDWTAAVNTLLLPAVMQPSW